MPERIRLDDDNAVHEVSSRNSRTTCQLKIHDKFKQEGDVAESGQYPDRPGEPNCIYYLRTGVCGYGSNCRYNHPTCVVQDAVYGFDGELPERHGEPDCGFFLKTGTCKYGPSCKYNHPTNRNGAGPVLFNILGLPMHPEENPCAFYMRTGHCKFGPTCKFHHPQPAVPGPVFPVNGAAPLGSAESSNLPIRAIPALPNPATAYVYDPRIQIPQAYMSMAVSPTLGIFPQQGWSTYLGNMSPISSTNSHGLSLNHNSSFWSFGESGSNGQVPYVAFFSPPYPERPDRPECRYFLNSGTCKYGSDCKYNHPKERIVHMLPHPLNPIGLPSRPGQPLCPTYSTFGICRNGQMCKFHHQVGGFPFNYSLNSAPLPPPTPIFEEPLPGRRSSTVVISSETCSPSNSAKVLDLIKKPDSATEKNHHLGTNGQQKSHEEENAGTPRNSSPASSPKHHD